MEIGIIGLGRMGGNMAQRLLKGGHKVVAFDFSAAAVQNAVSQGTTGAKDLPGLVSKLSKPRAVWLMVPSGDATEKTVNEVAALLAPGDAIIDGGNSNCKDSVRRAKSLKAKGIDFIDAGTSGGIWGLKEGYCLMVGGEASAVKRLEPVFKTLAPSADRGYAHVGPPGTGHYVKMIHNGIEYGMMQAYAEGFDLLQAKKEFNIDVAQVSELWRSGSVVRSWLLDLTAAALKEDPKLEGLAAFVEDSGEGRWTVQEAVDTATPAPVITAALFERFRSRQGNSYADRLLAAMRNQFGGHAVKRA